MEESTTRDLLQPTHELRRLMEKERKDYERRNEK